MGELKPKSALVTMSVGTFIDINLTQVPADYHSVFQTAQARLNAIIRTPKRPVQVGNSIVNMGIEITAEVREIDGSGGILGQAGPTQILKADGLPVLGVMKFDSADLDKMAQEGQLQDVITHEMLHVVGSGTLWAYKQLIDGAGGPSPKYIGIHAISEYRKLVPDNPGAIPVEQDGSAGTRDAHWDEETFFDELMTGFISGRVRALSRMSIASLIDLGYRVDLSLADPFSLPSATEKSALRKAPKSFHLDTTQFDEVERLDPQR